MTSAQLVRLRDLGEWTGGNTPSKANPAYWTGGTILWVSPKDMKVDEITSSEDRVTENALNEGRVSLVPEGSVLFVTRSGILAHTLPVAVTRVPVTINQDLKALTPRTGVMPKYVAHAVRGAARRILKQCSKHGTTVASIETKALLDFEIPLVDIDKQRRIVAEIEKQFSRLDEAVANLKRVKANLKHYKAAVLKAAVEGRLVPTEAELARREGRTYESGAQLLQRFVSARRSQWPGKGRYAEPAQPDSAKHRQVPEGWVRATIEQLGHVQLGRQRSPKNVSKDHPVKYIRAANITEAGLDLSDVLDMDFNPAEQERYRLARGDLILSEASGSPEQVGKPAVWREELPHCCFQNTVIRLRPSLVMSPFLFTCFLAYYVNGVFARVAAGVGINHLGAEKFANICVAVPPLTEQHRIVAEVQRRLSIVRELEAEVDSNLARAQALRQAVLARAFSGPGESAAAA